MAKWRKSIDVHGILNRTRMKEEKAHSREDLIKVHQEAGKEIAALLRPLKSIDEEFEDLAERFSDVLYDDDEINYVLSDLYDLADTHRIWLGNP